MESVLAVIVAVAVAVADAVVMNAMANAVSVLSAVSGLQQKAASHVKVDARVDAMSAVAAVEANVQTVHHAKMLQKTEHLTLILPQLAAKTACQLKLANPGNHAKAVAVNVASAVGVGVESALSVEANALSVTMQPKA